MWSYSGLKSAKFAPSSINWPKRGPESSQVAPSGPSSQKWLNRCYNCSYLDRFQKMWELLIKKFQFLSELCNQESHFVLQISQHSKSAQKWLCTQNLRMDISFQERKKIWKSGTWLPRYQAKQSLISFGTPCISATKAQILT